MRDNFLPALALVLLHEGGFVNDPQDPGGATNRGVTQAVYNSWRKMKGLFLRSVAAIEKSEVEAIYRFLYWDRVRGDDLPSGVDYAVFDYAVNSGVQRAVECLQTIVGVTPDGWYGPKTAAAIAKMPKRQIINEICTARQEFVEGLRTFKRFGKGWTRRIAEVEVTASRMI